MKRITVLFLALLMLVPGLTFASTADEKIQKLQDEIEELSDRLDQTERHAATDRVTITGDFRTKADTLHYKDIQYPAMAAMGGEGEYDVDNDIFYTSRLRLNLKSKVAKNVNFTGRLSMYKNWADSTGVKMMDSFSSTMDGTNSGNTTGDWLRVERAYFNWTDIGDSNFFLSIGRRPSTYGPPSQYRENEMRGGTPSGHLVHFNFDGITAGYILSEVTGVEGQNLRFCYGQGYESEWANGELMGQIDVKDTHLGGLSFDALNDGTNFLQFTIFKAMEVTDGFKGLAVMPMYDDDGNPMTPPAQNSQGWISRLQATENVGDLLLGGVGYAREEMNGVNYFLSLGWTQTDPNGSVSKAGYGGLLSDDGDTRKQDGYSVYAGLQVPAPMGKAGIEYNYGSQYWMPFSIGQDDMIGSKLAARGQVVEGYYIFEVNSKMFIKLGGLYYDYEYTGSGVPVGTPVKIDEIQPGVNVHANMPAIDTAWDGYASITVKF